MKVSRRAKILAKAWTQDREALLQLQQQIDAREVLLQRIVADAFNVGADERGGPWIEPRAVRLGEWDCAVSPTGQCAYDATGESADCLICLFCSRPWQNALLVQATLLRVQAVVGR